MVYNAADIQSKESLGAKALMRAAFKAGNYDACIRFASDVLDQDFDFAAWKLFLLSHVRMRNHAFLARVADDLDEAADGDLAAVKFATYLNLDRFDEMKEVLLVQLRERGMDKLSLMMKEALDSLTRTGDPKFVAWCQSLPGAPMESPFWRIVGAHQNRPVPFAAGDASAILYIDVSETIEHLETGRPFTGIQRVCTSLLSALNRRDRTGIEIRVAFRARHSAYHLSVSLAEFCNALHSADRVAVRDLALMHSWCPAVQHVFAKDWPSLMQVRPKRSDIFLFPGVFWGPHFWNYRQVVERYGCKVLVFIHDLIVIKDPAENASSIHNLAFADAVKYAITSKSRILVQSQATRFDVLDYARGISQNVSVSTLRFGDDNLLKRFQTTPALIPDALAGKRFMISVGTLSKRKNFTRLAHCFEAALPDLPDDCALVFCGMWDRASPEYHAIEAIKRRNGDRIFHIQAPNDDQLATLYEDCHALALISEDEGWGMPLSEAIEKRKPLLISDAGSLPEVGGEIATCVDPQDDVAIRNAIVEIFTSEQLLERTRAAYCAAKPRVWSDTAARLLELVAEI